jgi:hypothetical protein
MPINQSHTRYKEMQATHVITGRGWGQQVLTSIDMDDSNAHTEWVGWVMLLAMATRRFRVKQDVSRSSTLCCVVVVEKGKTTVSRPMQTANENQARLFLELSLCVCFYLLNLLVLLLFVVVVPHACYYDADDQQQASAYWQTYHQQVPRKAVTRGLVEAACIPTAHRYVKHAVDHRQRNRIHHAILAMVT